MCTMTRIQIFAEATYVLQSANTHGKGMNRTILPPAKGQK